MKGIIGTICGDVIGSSRENFPIKTKDFELFPSNSRFTDDTVMTLAIANWLIEDKSSKDILIKNLKYFGRLYPDAGYGGSFINWVLGDDSQPYGSWANGSAMRVSPCVYFGNSLDDVNDLAYMSASVTHNHPEGIKGALAVADAIYLARNNSSKLKIKKHIEKNYGYDLDFSVDEIRPSYFFDVSCQGSVPESIICFLDADDFEDAIRNAISLGGDADTQAAICGSIAAEFWDIPQNISQMAISYLDETLLDVLNKL